MPFLWTHPRRHKSVLSAIRAKAAGSAGAASGRAPFFFDSAWSTVAKAVRRNSRPCTTENDSALRSTRDRRARPTPSCGVRWRTPRPA